MATAEAPSGTLGQPARGPASPDLATPEIAAASPTGASARSEWVKSVVFFVAALALAIAAFIVQPPDLATASDEGSDTDSSSTSNLIRIFLPESTSDDELTIDVTGGTFDAYGFQSEIKITLRPPKDRKMAGRLLVDADHPYADRMSSCGLSPVVGDSRDAAMISDILTTWQEPSWDSLKGTDLEPDGFHCQIWTGDWQNARVPYATFTAPKIEIWQRASLGRDYNTAMCLTVTPPDPPVGYRVLQFFPDNTDTPPDMAALRPWTVLESSSNLRWKGCVKSFATSWHQGHRVATEISSPAVTVMYVNDEAKAKDDNRTFYSGVLLGISGGLIAVAFEALFQVLMPRYASWRTRRRIARAGRRRRFRVRW